MPDSNAYSVTLGQRIQSLSGFDASSDNISFGSVKNRDLTNQWLKEGIRETVLLLPRDLSERTKSYFTFESSPAGAELEVVDSEVYNVTLHNGTKMIECRKVNASQKGRLEDSGDILYATSTDPVYYLEANKINALPYGYECRYAGFNFVKDLGLQSNNYSAGNASSDDFMSVEYSDSTIPDFPYEAEDLVIIYASIKATEHLLAIEEDTELYFPIIANLKQNYKEKLSILNTGAMPVAQQQKR